MEHTDRDYSNTSSVNMLNNQIHKYYSNRFGYVQMLDIIAYTARYSITDWLPCPVPSWVPKMLGWILVVKIMLN